MELKFEERSYAGDQKNHRPTPEIHLDSEMQLLIVATPWGPRSSAKEVIRIMTDYLSLARGDQEATSPFERLSCLSPQANHLRIATLLANTALYREDNQLEYRSGVELFASWVSGNEMVWVQAGNPQILLARKGRTLMPLGSQLDLAYDMTEQEKLLPPLPAQLLGLDTSLNLTLNSFRVRDGDRLVLLSHSHLPDLLFSIKDNEIALDPMTRRLSQAGPSLAFWAGILSVSADKDGAS